MLPIKEATQIAGQWCADGESKETFCAPVLSLNGHVDLKTGSLIGEITFHYGENPDCMQAAAYNLPLKWNLDGQVPTNIATLRHMFDIWAKASIMHLIGLMGGEQSLHPKELPDG